MAGKHRCVKRVDEDGTFHSFGDNLVGRAAKSVVPEPLVVKRSRAEVNQFDVFDLDRVLRERPGKRSSRSGERGLSRKCQPRRGAFFDDRGAHLR